MARGRLKKISQPQGEQTEISDKKAKFGWCMDGYHEKCIRVISNGYECNCKCHKGE